MDQVIIRKAATNALEIAFSLRSIQLPIFKVTNTTDCIKNSFQQPGNLDSIQKVGVISVGMLIMTSRAFEEVTEGLYVEAWGWSSSWEIKTVIMWIVPLVATLVVVSVFRERKEKEELE